MTWEGRNSNFRVTQNCHCGRVKTRKADHGHMYHGSYSDLGDSPEDWTLKLDQEEWIRRRICLLSTCSVQGII